MRTNFFRCGALAVCGALSVGIEPAWANVSGTIIGILSGPVLSGNVTHDPNLFSYTFFDNSQTAVYSFSNSTNPASSGTPPLQTTGSAISWGDDSGGAGEQSTIDFFGASIPADVGQNFELGRITFQNGTSALTSLIFGATISFYVNSVSSANYLGSDTIRITTTNNLNVDPSQDADYLNICGNQSNICSQSIEATETSEGGTGVTVDLFGTIVGDPELDINAVQLAPGQDPTTNGFIGSNAPELPEPASLPLLGGVLLGLLGWGKLRRAAR